MKSLRLTLFFLVVVIVNGRAFGEKAVPPGMQISLEGLEGVAGPRSGVIVRGAEGRHYLLMNPGRDVVSGQPWSEDVIRLKIDHAARERLQWMFDTMKLFLFEDRDEVDPNIFWVSEIAYIVAKFSSQTDFKLYAGIRIYVTPQNIPSGELRPLSGHSIDEVPLTDIPGLQRGNRRMSGGGNFRYHMGCLDEIGKARPKTEIFELRKPGRPPELPARAGFSEIH